MITILFDHRERGVTQVRVQVAPGAEGPESIMGSGRGDRVGLPRAARMRGEMTEPAFVNHVGQCTAHLDRASRFYCEVLDFEVEREVEIPDQSSTALLDIEPPVGLRARYLRRGDFVLELMEFDRPDNPSATSRVFNEPGLTHLSLSVEDINAAADRAEALGGSVLRRFSFAVMISDPDGQIIELLPMSYKHRIAAERSAPDKP